MKTYLIVSFLLVFANSYGQSKADTIEIKSAFGSSFRQNGKVLKPLQLFKIVESNPVAFQEMKTAKKNYNIGYGLGFAGGFLIGWPVGASIAGGKANWGMAAVGAALVGVAIPFSSAYNKHAKKAVILYNKGLKETGFQNNILRLHLDGNGIGVSFGL